MSTPVINPLCISDATYDQVKQVCGDAFTEEYNFLSSSVSAEVRASIGADKLPLKNVDSHPQHGRVTVFVRNEKKRPVRPYVMYSQKNGKRFRHGMYRDVRVANLVAEWLHHQPESLCATSGMGQQHLALSMMQSTDE